MAKNQELVVASVSKMVVYNCGCACKYTHLGEWAGQGWKVLTCSAHTQLAGELAQRAAKDFGKYQATPSFPPNP